jgi:hypothetical protein
MTTLLSAATQRAGDGTPILLKILWRQGVPTLFAVLFAWFLLTIVHENIVAVRASTDAVPAIQQAIDRHTDANERALGDMLRVLQTMCVNAAATSEERRACLGR